MTHLSKSPWIPDLAAHKEALNDANNPDFLWKYIKQKLNNSITMPESISNSFFF